MDRKDRNTRGGSSRERATQRSARTQQVSRAAPDHGGTGTSRMLLTVLQHRQTIWNVYLNTSREAASAALSLEFEPVGENQQGVRHVRPVGDELRRTLQAGGALRKSDLAAELEQALAPDGTSKDGAAGAMKSAATSGT
jgi:hypothetical protein